MQNEGNTQQRTTHMQTNYDNHMSIDAPLAQRFSLVNSLIDCRFTPLGAELYNILWNKLGAESKGTILDPLPNLVPSSITGIQIPRAYGVPSRLYFDPSGTCWTLGLDASSRPISLLRLDAEATVQQVCALQEADASLLHMENGSPSWYNSQDMAFVGLDGQKVLDFSACKGLLGDHIIANWLLRLGPHETVGVFFTPDYSSHVYLHLRGETAGLVEVQGFPPPQSLVEANGAVLVAFNKVAVIYTLDLKARVLSPFLHYPLSCQLMGLAPCPDGMLWAYVHGGETLLLFKGATPVAAARHMYTMIGSSLDHSVVNPMYIAALQKDDCVTVALTDMGSNFVYFLEFTEII